MPRGRGNKLAVSGSMVHKQCVLMACGKSYNGNIKTVNKLMSMHKKVCEICKQADTCKSNTNSQPIAKDNYSANLKILRREQQEQQKYPCC